jgi:protein-tyrosine phosphatase
MNDRLPGPAPSIRAILFVCLGNICRSPTAEAVFREMLKDHAPQLKVEIDSAGTADYHVGEPPDLRSQSAAQRRGIDMSGLRARQITTGDFARFDLILAMDGENLRALLALRPAHSRAQLRLFLEYAPQADRREVPDPYYRDSSAFEEVLDLSFAASRGLISTLQEIA